MKVLALLSAMSLASREPPRMTTPATIHPPLDWRQIEMIEPEMVAIMRHKSPAQSIAMMIDANETMRSLIAARLQSEHPHWSAEDVRAAVARRMLDAANHST